MEEFFCWLEVVSTSVALQKLQLNSFKIRRNSSAGLKVSEHFRCVAKIATKFF
jgi:hypothetical protein